MTAEHDAAVESLISQISARRSDAVATLELLQGHARDIEANTSALENPQAIKEYLEFFIQLIASAVADCERIAAELTTEGVKAEHVATLRTWGSHGATEQRRCLVFRDKWINKPLPHERMRPILNDISVTTRDQLTAFRDLLNAATRVEELLKELAPPKKEEKRGLDRRQLFTRLFKP